MSPGSAFVARAVTLRLEIRKELERLTAVTTDGTSYAPFAAMLRNELERADDKLGVIIDEAQSKGSILPQEKFTEVRGQVTLLFGEALELRLADFIRSNLDEGACQLADKFLTELAMLVSLQLAHLSTLSSSEFLGVSARIVRLRYPAITIWDLPVLAHEFGHSFGPLWHIPGESDTHPYETFTRRSGPTYRSIMGEYFCDLMATFLLGPAYPSMCILNRFDPTGFRDGMTHPADAKRAWWVLRALELLAGMTAEGEGYLGIVAKLRNFWTEFGKASRAKDLPDADVEFLEGAIQSLFPTMQQAIPGAAYIESGPAWALVADYKDARIRKLKRSDLRHLLNAMWFARGTQTITAQKADDINSWAQNCARSIP